MFFKDLYIKRELDTAVTDSNTLVPMKFVHWAPQESFSRLRVHACETSLAEAADLLLTPFTHEWDEIIGSYSSSRHYKCNWTE